MPGGAPPDNPSGFSGGDLSAKADPMADIKVGFFQECEQLLEDLVDGLEALRTGHATDDSFHSVFRAVHSIKGGAAAFALNDLTDFAHALETRLAAYRDSGTAPTASEVPALERAADRLAHLVGLATRGEELSDEDRLSDVSLLARADPYAGHRGVDLFIARGTENAREVLRALEPLGNVTVCCDVDNLPELESYDPSILSLSWHIVLETELPEDLLAAALQQIAPNGELERKERRGEAQTAQVSTNTLQDHGKQQATSTYAPTIRVGLDRIDKLINLVGELVINQAMLTKSAGELGAAANSDHMISLEELIRLTRDIQDSVMQIRAQPVKPLFQRMARICRDAAEISGKPASLICEGQDTEVDKTVIESLADPLTHMIRNAVGHGIEAPEERNRLGKPQSGQITLRASHRSGKVLIEIIDDGAGIDRPRVLERAKSLGLVSNDAQLAPSEIDQLLFKPGFTTATTVSPLSGRGVGMDVVRASIQALGGRITIESNAGKGTRFEIALPLTLAVLEAMTVGVAGQTLVFPLSTIHETLLIEPSAVITVSSGKRLLRYNGAAVTLFDVGEELGYHAYRADLANRIALIIGSEGHEPVALAIDDIFEQRQIVIKGLQDGFETASCIAAATILGDGRIALIVDPYDPSLSPSRLSAGHEAAVPVDLAG